MESIIERSAGLGFWLAANKVVEVVAERYSTRTKIMLYILVLIVTVIIIYKIEQRREERKIKRTKEKDDLFERCMKYVADHNWPPPQEH